MEVLNEYQTFNNETGEIRMEIKLVKINNFYYIMQNGELIQKFASWLKAKKAFNDVYGMDCYIENKLKHYEVVR